MRAARGGRAAARAFRVSAAWRGEPALSEDATSSSDAGAGGGSLAGVLRLRKTRQVPVGGRAGTLRLGSAATAVRPEPSRPGCAGDVVGRRRAGPSGGPAPALRGRMVTPPREAPTSDPSAGTAAALTCRARTLPGWSPRRRRRGLAQGHDWI